MRLLGKTASFLLAGCALSAFELNVHSSAHSVYVGEPVRLTYTFAYKPSEEAVDFRFAAPALTHIQVLKSRSGTSHAGGREVWRKTYVVAPLQSGEVPTGTAAMNVAKRAYEKDAWGQWMPKVKWEQHRFASVGLFANPVPSGISAVGRFSMRAVTDSNETESGKPVHLTLSVYGCGNLRTAEFPRPDIKGVSVFVEEETQKAQWKDGCYYSESNRTFALVGEKDFMIPSMALRTFDPRRNAVVAAQSLPIPVRVKTAVRHIETKKGEEAMTIWSLAAGMVIGFGIGVAAALLWLRRKRPERSERRIRNDSLRAALITLFKHLDDPEAKRSAEAVEKHLYEGAAAPDSDTISKVLSRLKRPV